MIIHGDALEELKKIEEDFYDAVVTDPPYGIGVYKSGTMGGGVLAKQSQYKKVNWDNEIPGKEVFGEMKRVSKSQIIFGGNYFAEYLGNSSCWIVWDKDNGDNNFADCELIWTSFNSSVRKVTYKWQGMLQEDMRFKEKREHPTQKPLPLMNWILDTYLSKDNKIIDPFMGSGSTLVAAKQLGMKCDGIEKNKDYIDIAEKRIDAVQPSMF